MTDLDRAAQLFQNILGASGLPQTVSADMDPSTQALIDRLALVDESAARTTKFVAVNRKPVTGGWLLVDVSPGPRAPWWHVAVVEHGTGVLSYTRRAVPSDGVRWHLEAAGVSGADFREEPATESHANPYQPSDGVGERGRDERPVYFIQADGGPIKIGVAAHPARRLAELQTSSPYELHLLAMMPGQGALGESALHARFEHRRMRGEWFAPAPDLLAYIEANGVPA